MRGEVELACAADGVVAIGADWDGMFVWEHSVEVGECGDACPSADSAFAEELWVEGFNELEVVFFAEGRGIGDLGGFEVPFGLVTEQAQLFIGFVGLADGDG